MGDEVASALWRGRVLRFIRRPTLAGKRGSQLARSGDEQLRPSARNHSNDGLDQPPE